MLANSLILMLDLALLTVSELTRRILLVRRPGSHHGSSSCCCSVAKLCPTLCDSVDCNMLGSPVLLCFLEFAQIHVRQVGDAI